MAELLILVVIAGVVLLYAVDRTRKLRARARQMSAMNERLDVAAAKVDEQQERKQARVRASAELTSVLPAIKRPPLTLPGVPGSAAGPAGEPAAPEPDAGPAAERAAGHAPAAVGDTAAAGDDPAAAADAGNIPGAGAEESPATQAAQDQAGSPAAGDRPRRRAVPGTAGEVPGPHAGGHADHGPGDAGRHGRPGASGDVRRHHDHASGTGSGPAPAGGAARPPAFSRPRPRTSRPRAASPGPVSPGPADPGPASPMLASPGPASRSAARFRPAEHKPGAGQPGLATLALGIRRQLPAPRRWLPTEQRFLCKRSRVSSSWRPMGLPSPARTTCWPRSRRGSRWGRPGGRAPCAGPGWTRSTGGCTGPGSLLST